VSTRAPASLAHIQHQELTRSPIHPHVSSRMPTSPVRHKHRVVTPPSGRRILTNLPMPPGMHSDDVDSDMDKTPYRYVIIRYQFLQLYSRMNVHGCTIMI
jgi:hypothetical protein